MAVGHLHPNPHALKLVRGAAQSRLLVYREGLVLPPRTASQREARGVRGRPPSVVRLEAFQRVVTAELAEQLTVHRARRGVLCLTADSGAPALQRALRFARMLGLSGWESREGSFARLSAPAPDHLHRLVRWLCEGETAGVTLVRGREALELRLGPCDGRVQLAERALEAIDGPLPLGGAHRPSRLRELPTGAATEAVLCWANGVAATYSLDVRLAPPAPRAFRECAPEHHAP